MKIIFIILYDLLYLLFAAILRPFVNLFKRSTKEVNIKAWFELTRVEKEEYLKNPKVPKELKDLYLNNSTLIFKSDVFKSAMEYLNYFNDDYASLSVEIIKMFAFLDRKIYTDEHKKSQVETEFFFSQSVYHLISTYPELMFGYLKRDDENETLFSFFISCLTYRIQQSGAEPDLIISKLEKQVLDKFNSVKEDKLVNSFFTELSLSV
ncbi:MAG: hypothetical protein MK202_01460 [Tenacibaculum sp.]|nr:hypothetical protein [Tenacibaculum sp.]